MYFVWVVTQLSKSGVYLPPDGPSVENIDMLKESSQKPYESVCEKSYSRRRGRDAMIQVAKVENCMTYASFPSSLEALASWGSQAPSTPEPRTQ